MLFLVKWVALKSGSVHNQDGLVSKMVQVPLMCLVAPSPAYLGLNLHLVLRPDAAEVFVPWSDRAGAGWGGWEAEFCYRNPAASALVDSQGRRQRTGPARPDREPALAFPLTGHFLSLGVPPHREVPCTR